MQGSSQESPDKEKTTKKGTAQKENGQYFIK
jgi:hypothetical protein